MGQRGRTASDSVYQKQLVGVQPQQVGNGWQNVGQSGLNLAKSLGVLSETTYQNVLQKEQRLKATGEQQAANVMNKASLEDLQKEGTVNLLTKLGVAELAKNPYAIAYADQIKGNRLSAYANLEYQTFMSNQDAKDKPKNDIEAAEHYSKFMGDKWTEYAGDNGYTEHMKNGFFESFPTNQFTAAQMRNKEISAETRDTLISGMEADFGRVATAIYDSHGKGSKEVYLGMIKSIRDNPAYAPLDVGTTIKILEKSLGTFARSCPDLMTDVAMLDFNPNPVDGKTKRINEVLDCEPYMVIARAQMSQNAMARKEEIFDELIKIKDSKAREEYINKLPLSDYEIGKSLWDSATSFIEQQEKEEAKERIRQAGEQWNAEIMEKMQPQINENIIAEIIASSDRKTHLPNGRLRANTKAELTPIYYTYIDSNGREVRKQYEYTDDDINSSFAYVWQKRMSKESPPAQKVNELLDLINHPLAKDFRTVINNNANAMLADVNVSKIDKNRKLQHSPELDIMLEMQKNNPSKFNALYGDDVASQSNLINDLSITSRNEGLVCYAEVRDKFEKNPQLLSDYKKKAVYAITNNTVDLRLYGFDGSKQKANLLLMSSPDVMEQVKLKSAYHMARGVSEKEAINMALKETQASKRIWHNAVLPVSPIHDIDKRYGQGAGKGALDYAFASTAKKFMVSGAELDVRWDYNNSILFINVRGSSTQSCKFTVDELFELGNNVAYLRNQKARKQQPKDMDIKDLNIPSKLEQLYNEAVDNVITKHKRKDK